LKISAKGRDELVVRNLPKVKPKTPLLGISSTAAIEVLFRPPPLLLQWTAKAQSRLYIRGAAIK
jgi:hypothetical protein